VPVFDSSTSPTFQGTYEAWCLNCEWPIAPGLASEKLPSARWQHGEHGCCLWPFHWPYLPLPLFTCLSAILLILLLLLVLAPHFSGTPNMCMLPRALPEHAAQFFLRCSVSVSLLYQHKLAFILLVLVTLLFCLLACDFNSPGQVTFHLLSHSSP
jgi:hypothetical protein